MRQFFQYLGIACVLAATFLSCEKIVYRTGSIEGKAIAINDNTPLAGYTVRLLETEIPSKPFSSVIVNEIASTIIANDGSFYFNESLNKRARFDYSVSFDKGGDYFFPYREGLEVIVETATVEKVKDQIVMLKLARGAYLKFQVFNINAASGSDKIIVGVDNGLLYLDYTGYTGDGGEANESFNEISLNDPFKPTFSGGLKIQWQVTRNGQTSVFSDSIFLEQNEERIYEIYY